MCPVSQFVCVEVEEGFKLCEGFILHVFAHTVESIQVPWGAHWNSLYFSCLPFVLHLKITEPEQNTEGHVTGTVPAPQQILGKHSFPSSSLTPTFIESCIPNDSFHVHLVCEALLCPQRCYGRDMLCLCECRDEEDLV